jgi:hypothetical protein
MRNSLVTNYPYLNTSIDQFGFCYWPIDYTGTNPPPVSISLTETDAIQLAKNFVSTHPIETGIKNINNLVIAKVYSLPGSAIWMLVTSNQKVNDIEVLYAQVTIEIKNGSLFACSGNWFPDIYIPDKFNFSESAAKSHLVGKNVTHYDIGGQKYYVNISKPDIDKCSGLLKVIPVKSENKIELRLTWMFDIPGPVYCKVYADVMTGEIIQQTPTIIS